MKQSEIRSGVHVHLIPTKKFKTVHLAIQLTAPLTEQTMTSRALVAELLAKSSQRYPTQTATQRQLANLYGAGFRGQALRRGQTHVVSFTLNLVDGRFVETEDLFGEGLEFVRQALFEPQVTDGAFNARAVGREVENLRDDFEAIYNEKGYYAQTELQKLYFDEKAQQLTSRGDVSHLERQTAAGLYETYQQMMTEDRVDVFLLGDVDNSHVDRLTELLPFGERQASSLPLFYDQPIQEVVRYQSETQPVHQAKLHMAFHQPFTLAEADYPVLQVFNGLFGGLPHSKLFTEVREKESLAYYASSSFDPLRRVGYVQAGIDSKNADHVEALVLAQLDRLAMGDVSEVALAQTQEMLIQRLKQLGDQPGTLLSAKLEDVLAGREKTVTEKIADIQDVTIEDVMRVARQYRHQATFLLKGAGV